MEEEPPPEGDALAGYRRETPTLRGRAVAARLDSISVARARWKSLAGVRRLEVELARERARQAQDYLLFFFTAITERFQSVHEINKEIVRRFREEGIEIPFPQRDVHMIPGEEGPAPEPPPEPGPPPDSGA